MPDDRYNAQTNLKEVSILTKSQSHDLVLQKRGCRGRDGPNQDYLHMGGKLFQEWICMAWLTIENLRLEYQRRNQKALRADTYKSVREATEERLQEVAALAPREDGIYNDDHRAPAIGRKILCSSFQGVQDGTMQNSKMQWLLLSSSGSRPCPGQLQKTSRSTETQRHSLVSGLDLEIDSIITSYHHHNPPTHQQTFLNRITLESLHL